MKGRDSGIYLQNFSNSRGTTRESPHPFRASGLSVFSLASLMPGMHALVCYTGSCRAWTDARTIGGRYDQRVRWQLWWTT